MESGLPSAMVTANPGTTVCHGTAVNYSVATTFGGSAPALTWVVNGTNVTTGTTYSYTSRPGRRYRYTGINEPSNYQCRTETSVQSNHVAMSVQTQVIPTVTIIANPNGANIAKGQELTLTATVTNGGPTPTYQWFVNGAPIPGANLPTYSSSNFNNMDSITCQVVSDGTCSGLTGFNSVTVHVASTGVAQIANGSGDIQHDTQPEQRQLCSEGYAQYYN